MNDIKPTSPLVAVSNYTINSTIYISLLPDSNIYAIITGLTLLTNVSMLCLVIKERKLHTMSNWILASMFCAGIAFAIAYLLPRWVIFFKWNLYHSFACLILPMTGSGLIINFNLHLALVSLDRYFCFTSPFTYQRPQSRVIAKLAIASVWVLSSFTAYIPLFTFLIPSPGKCAAQQRSEIYYNYLCTVFVILFFLPLAVLIVTYSRILWIVNNHTQRRQEGIVRSNSVTISAFHRNLRAIKYMIALIGLFILFWLPYIILFLVYYATSIASVHTLILIRNFQYLAFSYPAVNPILYVYFTPCMRHVMKKKLSRSIQSIAQILSNIA
ncbi:uncharacterized protein TRIADDRAFT_30368 [Trichoplax adhaerens]|uniref:G-protein coupled receptors family 1 profile domain-containing protein n=1 Tax=Trichoplax adhaerens TaxID=10228 RepID=B3S774_TRIAD|nr:hypothetical protein TRIADDRAFT_30368 [Trichoplax adhaerens]EDV21521.1 hypothetical protein TRIADDRAFT_30368 [Trichoplax adhaerens]|eukprot:XP_002116121.1 hypothetical protein TRIADDRAFT_30368 [Trichoplax adhaerens]